MRIHVAVATTGRAEILRRTVGEFARQSRPADGIVVVGVVPEDVDGLGAGPAGVEVILGPRGLCKQRNTALDRLAGRCDVVVFFDDDFVPSEDYLEKLERLFAEQSAVVGATGRLLADGAQAKAIQFDDAISQLESRRQIRDPGTENCSSLYGCNMAIRMAAAEGLRFDERLPLYGWQEDVDFSNRLGRRGRLVETGLLTGIHLGTRGGRTSGRRLGYSQIANLVYLCRKGTMGLFRCEVLLLRNLAANLIRSLVPEPDVDRRGRLAGNFLAILDLLRGRIDPCRVETL